MTWITPLLIAFVALVRGTFNLAARWIPLTSFVVGIGAGLLLIDHTVLGGVVGAIIGLTASGLYDVGKKSVLGV